MRELGQRLGLALEALQHTLQHERAEDLPPDDLDGDLAFQARILGLVDQRHPAFAQLLKDAVASDGLTC